MSDVLSRLSEEIRAQGGLLTHAEAGARAPVSGAAWHGPLAAAGPRAAGREDEYSLLVEAIREGYQLHYREGRVLAPHDPDLALLAGDRLYALGLARLAELGDVEAVSTLADVIALCAQAHAVADPGLAEAVWEAGAVAVGWGAGPAHAAATERARRGEPQAAEALRAAARQAVENMAPRR